MIPATTIDPLERLSPLGKARLVAEILSSYVSARRLLASSGLPETVAVVRSRAVPDRPGESSPSAARRIGTRLAHAVGRTLRPLPTDSRCLMRALVLTDLLARRGIESSLVIGVQSEPAFDAHAWVEYRGYPLQPTGTFRRLTEL